MKAEDLYDVLRKELNFDEMINLYKLIKHKIEFLNDEPRMSIGHIDTSPSISLY